MNYLTCFSKVRLAASEAASSLGTILPSAGVSDLLYDILALDSTPASGWVPAAGKILGCGAVLRTSGDRYCDSFSSKQINLILLLESDR